MPLAKSVIVALILVAFAGGTIAAYQFLSRDSVAMVATRGGPPIITVETVKAEMRTAERRVEAVGTTLAKRSVEIVPLTSGRVSQIDFEPSQRVDEGHVLVRLDDDIEQADLAEAEAKLTDKKLAVERASTLRKNNTVAEATLTQLQSEEAVAQAFVDRARRKLADREIKAPFNGIVGFRRVDIGARIDDETIITMIDDRSEMEIEFAVPEIMFSSIRIGQPIVADGAAFAGRRFEGTVGSIDSRIDQASRSFKVRGVFSNPDLLLPAGMFMHVAVVLESHDAVMVPEEALSLEGTQAFVYVVEDGKAIRHEVKTGRREPGAVELVSGVKLGDMVVVRGIQHLRDGSPVKNVSDSMARAASG